MLPAYQRTCLLAISPCIMANPFWGWLQHGACQPRILRSPPGIGYGRSDARSLTMPVQADRIDARPDDVSGLPRGDCRILGRAWALLGLKCRRLLKAVELDRVPPLNPVTSRGTELSTRLDRGTTLPV